MPTSFCPCDYPGWEVETGRWTLVCFECPCPAVSVRLKMRGKEAREPSRWRVQRRAQSDFLCQWRRWVIWALGQEPGDAQTVSGLEAEQGLAEQALWFLGGSRFSGGTHRLCGRGTTLTSGLCQSGRCWLPLRGLCSRASSQVTRRLELARVET